MKILLLAEDKSANTLAWVSAFKEQGCEIKIVSARADKSYGNVIALGMNYLPPRMKFLLGAKRIKDIIEKESPDIVIGYRITSYGYLASISGFHPLVLAAQNEKIVRVPAYLLPFKPPFDYCARYALRNADLIHSWGSNISKNLILLGADPKHVLTMHRGIDTSIFYPSTERNFSCTKPPVLVSTRSLYPDYKIDLVIRAFALFTKVYPSAVFKIVGDGPERKKLEKLSSKLKCQKNIFFLGRQSPEQIADVLRKSDIYISLTQTEGISSSLIEACACGLFPIISDIPASREIVKNGENGILISSPNPSNVNESLITAYKNIEMRKKALEINKTIVRERFDSKKNNAFFISEYRRLIGKKH